jgi:hypothetical protein
MNPMEEKTMSDSDERTTAVQRSDERSTPQPAELLRQAREALAALLNRDQRNTCQHENTHRGGVLWTICDDCDAKWADDRGGMPEWKDPPEWEGADRAIAAIDAARRAAPTAVPAEPAALTDEQIKQQIMIHGSGGWQSFADMTRFARAIERECRAAAPGAAPSYEGPKAWTPEEQAMGNKGIRWVTETFVAGRPTAHDVMEYLKARGAEAECGCEKCRAFFAPGAAPSDTSQDVKDLKAVDSVLDDVLGDIAGWEDKALAEAVTEAKQKLRRVADKLVLGVVAGGAAPSEAAKPVATGVDWLGLALDLEAQAKRVESQTVERAMLAGARGLRLMGGQS